MTEPAGGCAATGQDQGGSSRWRVLGLCLVAGFMTLLDVSIVNVALPSIQQGLGAPPVALAWIVSGYALTFGLVLVPSGRLGDDRGRGTMFLTALAAFTVASAVAGFARNPTWLVLGRLAQGIAGGMLNPQVLGLIQQQFAGRERGKAFGWFGTVVGISTAVGPLVGGLIIQLAGSEHGWRWVFFVNLPIGVVAFLFGLRLLPRDRPTGQTSSLDVVGVVLLGGGLSCLLLPLIQRESGHGLNWVLFVAAAVLLILFVLWEYRYQERGYAPLVSLRLLKIRSYAFGSSLGLLYFAGFTGIFFVLAVYFQRGLGYTALQAGLALTPFALGSATGSAVGGRIVYRMGRKLVVIGLCAALVGLLATDLLLAAHLTDAAVFFSAISLFVAGIGTGLVISPNQTVTLSEVDTAHAGTAAGVQQTGQRVGSAVGTATASGLFFGSLPQGGYDAAISTGLIGSICFVAAALIVGVTELLLPARR